MASAIFSITKRCIPTNICNEICPQRKSAVVRIFYSFSHPLHHLYVRVPERFRHRQFFSITRRGPSTHICNKICLQRICMVVRIFRSFLHPLHHLHVRVPERFRHRQFLSITREALQLISEIKFVPKEYARLLEFFFRSGTPFITYT